jgi:hypothetical protein
MRVAPVSHCGLRNADCGLKERTVVFESAIRNPQSAIDRSVPSDVPQVLLPAGVLSFEHWLDLNA